MREPLVFVLTAVLRWKGVSCLSAPKSSVVIGLNKYSHNACCCVVDVASGSLLYAGEKERLTRCKNDGGAVGDLVRHALASCGRSLEDVAQCVANDHHRSIAREEAAFSVARDLGLAYGSSGMRVEEVMDPYNRLPRSSELSHHLAHAMGGASAEVWSGAAEAEATETATEGASSVVVVMDGMGEEARRFREGDASFHSDADLDGFGACAHVLNASPVDSFASVPDDARECESAYALGGDGRLVPLVKRWCVGVDGAFFGYSDWFAAPMDSLGAGYSHVSRVVFGDWNACGKVMGLAPWGDPEQRGEATWGRKTRDTWAPLAVAAARALRSDGDRPRLYSGRVVDGCVVDRTAIVSLLRRAAEALPPSAFDAPDERRRFLERFPPDRPSNLWNWSDEFRLQSRASCAVLSFFAQSDLETVGLDFCKTAVDRAEAASGDRPATAVLCGGVGLNSVLNGRAEQLLDVEVRVPSAPGDEGCALGCARRALELAAPKKAGGQARLETSLLPYSGADVTANDIDEAVLDFGDWVVPVKNARDDDEVVRVCADALSADADALGIVFFFEGRPEFGPRALGHRSIVATATRADVVDAINDVVKGREDFRPLAPAVLEEEAAHWFAGDFGATPSPHMSRVWTLTPEAARRAPACAHVDLSARPQTVSSSDARLRRYRAVIAAVFERTGVPFVLNTSFNTKPSEPVAESPRGALSSFLAASARAAAQTAHRLDLLLALGPNTLLRPRPCPVDETTGAFPDADRTVPARKHASYEIAATVASDDLDDRAPVLTVLDLDEPLEDATQTTRGVRPFLDALEAAVYERCDGATSASDIADDVIFDIVAEASDPIRHEDVYLRLARLWRHTLIRLPAVSEP